MNEPAVVNLLKDTPNGNGYYDLEEDCDGDSLTTPPLSCNQLDERDGKCVYTDILIHCNSRIQYIKLKKNILNYNCYR